MLPQEALATQQWCKLICGASLHHTPMIRTLALIYTLAGVDCIDVAADPAMVRAAQGGIAQAQLLDPRCSVPWIMVSFNAGEDPHFRKAQLTATCPPQCPQPCVGICPPQAISGSLPVEISPTLCYGCGRCQPVCPSHLLDMIAHPVSAARVFPQLQTLGIQAVEIHTRPGELAAFADVWQHLQSGIESLELVSISFGDGENLGEYLASLVEIMSPHPPRLMWQTDGRPMSGDIGVGATRATLNLARKVLGLGLPGYVQLAGGTNAYSMIKARRLGIPVVGVAYGSYARHLVAEVADQPDLEQHPQRLWASVEQARQLLATVKQAPAYV